MVKYDPLSGYSTDAIEAELDRRKSVYAESPRVLGDAAKVILSYNDSRSAKSLHELAEHLERLSGAENIGALIKKVNNRLDQFELTSNRAGSGKGRSRKKQYDDPFGELVKRMEKSPNADPGKILDRMRITGRQRGGILSSYARYYSK
ncbi:MAG: hypothetical protein IIA87_01565 [Nanoarchaeota archaeon]|nr:hypothetical protein [Nanoarchaeota archaeon]